MASISAPLSPAPAAGSSVDAAVSGATLAPYVGVVVAAAVGALSGVLATWLVVATQTLQMSL